MTTQPVTLVNSQTRILDSAHTGRQYRITISLPLGYHARPSEPWPFHSNPDGWPVVYVLDGNWYHGMVTDMIRPTAWCGSTSDAIVVGIGYPEGDDAIAAFRTSFVRRDADLTPVRDEPEELHLQTQFGVPVLTGDAANFLRFIRDELIPLIETDFRADPTKRILLGHSYGGLFGLFALFEAPGLFSTLILGSPTLSFRYHWTFEREKAFAQSQQPLPARVFMFVGKLEDGPGDRTYSDVMHFALVLQLRNYAGFSHVTHVIPDQNHCEVAGAGFQAGLIFALRKQG